MSSIIRHLGLPRDVLGIITHFYCRSLWKSKMRRVCAEYHKAYSYDESRKYLRYGLESDTLAFNWRLIDYDHGAKYSLVYSLRSMSERTLPAGYQYSGIIN